MESDMVESGNGQTVRSQYSMVKAMGFRIDHTGEGQPMALAMGTRNE